ncbi:bifunctional adenosylcobinamide kinase/adenosylcobinamide-phosphate guanylyltransferase [Fibrisoma montanum]|uniref:Adenosylcobinamide kinase n=1 Tax=Fibrisoma montanum TaxID=2305895 RepID=A0A418LZY1_9BACT|nr:bifunctional adenosylcobinamide kinase/adenosylcobinamide-phosphate guanylyltransferase [Fibrisoma montanum]RIV18940.1 bifunctional adenosylcobinamide kinase/adenosylcobinamide-phosphate guanylyltransferase [Fibrisoma montanum]
MLPRQAYLHLITGGARSGKSRYAQQLARTWSETPVYVATARIWDDEFAGRVTHHRQDRGSEWTVFEEQRYVSRLPVANQVVMIDCVTLWLTNFFQDTRQDVDQSLQLFRQEIDTLLTMPGRFIIVTNELGMGVHAETAIGRAFTDLQGWANQYVAGQADAVTLLVSGIPVPIKTAIP